MLFILMIMLYIAILWIELPQLLRNRWYKDMVVFGLLFAIGVFLSLAQYYQWPVYNPFLAAVKVFE